jgi:hypothetical protein
MYFEHLDETNIGTIQGLKTMNDAQQLLKYVIIKDVEGKNILSLEKKNEKE